MLIIIDVLKGKASTFNKKIKKITSLNDLCKRKVLGYYYFKNLVTLDNFVMCGHYFPGRQTS